MPRYRITIEYDGHNYSGWQRQQAGVITIQGRIEEAIYNFCGEKITLFGAGRTDAGVHAHAQVAHCDLNANWPENTILRALNAHLVETAISIIAVAQTDKTFDARLSANARHYLYRILNRPPPPALDAHRVWWISQPLNVAKMHEAAQHLVGHYDFSTFRDSKCQAKSPWKTLDKLSVIHQGDEIHIVTQSKSFLHTQVRSMVGCLKLVGNGKWHIADLVAARDACDRKACGALAPSRGLYLTQVDY